MVKGIKMMIISVLLASIMMPFHVFADTLNSSHVVGINVYTERLGNDTQQVGNDTIWRNYVDVHIQFELDDAYLGWQNIGIVVSYKNYYYGSQNPHWGDTSQSWSGNYYINGSSFEIIVPISFYSASSAYYQNGAQLPNSDSFITVTYATQGNITPMASLSTLDDVVNVLNDIDSHITIDVLDELQNIVSNTSLSNDYLEIISQTKQWNIPFESLSFVYSMMYYGAEIVDIIEYNNFQFPMFKMSSGQLMYTFTSANQSPFDSYTMICFMSRAPGSNVGNFLRLDDGSYTERKRLNQFIIGNAGQFAWTLTKFTISNFTTATNYNHMYNYFDGDNYIIPIYFGMTARTQYVSTDFALLFGLSNTLLDNLNIIAQGTTGSNQSTSDLDSAAQDMNDSFDDFADFENSIDSSFDTQMQNIDFSNPLQQNSGILPAANFVIAIFNGLISNNPLSVLIIIIYSSPGS